MKVYIASSGDNDLKIKLLCKKLIANNITPFWFLGEYEGKILCNIWDANKAKTEEEILALKSDHVQITDADILLMVMPCGYSSYLEAGIAAEQGKRIIILGAMDKYEIVTRYAEKQCFTASELIKYLNGNIEDAESLKEE